MIVEICFEEALACGAGCRAKRLQVGGERFQNPGFDGEVRELPFPAYFDEATGLEFLDVVRQGRGRDGKGLASHGTA